MSGEPDHLGAIGVLGPPRPRNPLRWLFLAGKSAAVCLLVLWVDRWTGNPDHVTSTFVGVLCVSPVVLMGLRRALDQVAGSLLGGVAGTLAALAGLPALAGVPLAVGAAVLACLGAGFARGYTVAAFSALFVQLVPWGEPLPTLGVRVLAVMTGVAAAFVVNVVVSSASYRSIFRRRLRFVEATVSALLVEAAESGPRVVRRGFPVLAELEQELALARGELTWRASAETRRFLETQAERVEHLRRLLHLVLDLVYRLDEEGLPPDAAREWLRWLVARGGDEPPVPDVLVPITRRIRRLGRELRG